MGVELILKLAGLGILIAVITQLLKQQGRDDIAMIAAIAGLVIALTIIIVQINDLLTTITQTFGLY